MPCTPTPGGVDAEQMYNLAHRRRIGPPRRSREELVERRRAGADIAADVIGVVSFEIPGPITARASTRSRKPGANRSICSSMRGQHVDRRPGGTWQYVHTT
jgi:hypothetical protein